MTRFYVTFKSSTTANAMVRGIQTVTHDYRQVGTTFHFAIDWNANQIANLKGRIENAAGRNSISVIGVDDDSSSESDSDSSSSSSHSGSSSGSHHGSSGSDSD